MVLLDPSNPLTVIPLGPWLTIIPYRLLGITMLSATPIRTSPWNDSIVPDASTPLPFIVSTSLVRRRPTHLTCPSAVLLCVPRPLCLPPSVPILVLRPPTAMVHVLVPLLNVVLRLLIVLKLSILLALLLTMTPVTVSLNLCASLHRPTSSFFCSFV